jgi:3-hydroxyacyl-CoA dehydrogenase
VVRKVARLLITTQRNPAFGAVQDLIKICRRDGRCTAELDDEEILDRLLLPMIDEGRKIVAEGIALRASDIDVVWIHGYGWPRWLGGPMYYGDMGS